MNFQEELNEYAQLRSKYYTLAVKYRAVSEVILFTGAIFVIASATGPYDPGSQNRAVDISLVVTASCVIPFLISLCYTYAAYRIDRIRRGARRKESA